MLVMHIRGWISLPSQRSQCSILLELVSLQQSDIAAIEEHELFKLAQLLYLQGWETLPPISQPFNTRSYANAVASLGLQWPSKYSALGAVNGWWIACSSGDNVSTSLITLQHKGLILESIVSAWKQVK